MITLETQSREKSGNIVDLRKAGRMPAVLYGKKTPSQAISVLHKDFVKVWKTAGESGVVTLKDPVATNKDAAVEVLIHAVDIDPVTDIPRHADFYVFEKGKKIHVSVPLEFVGVAPAVKDLGGSLVKALHELKISADPQHIPHAISVDISSLLTFDSQILAGDLVLPTGVVLDELPHEVVAGAAAPKAEEVEESTPVDLSSIEVAKKGKKEEEEVVEA